MIVATAGALLVASQQSLLPADVSMQSLVKISVAVAILVGIAIFAWLWGGARSTKARTDIPVAALPTSVASMDYSKPVSRLQVRAVGVTVNDLTGTEILEQITAKGQTHASIFSAVAGDYPSTWTDKSLLSRMRHGLAFKLGAGPAVDYTPLPVFVYGPAKAPESPFGAAFTVTDARQEGSIPFQLFMTQKAANGEAPSLDDVFAFFDANPDAPAAVIFAADGMVTRKLLGKPGSGVLPSTAVVPTVFDSNVALLVTCPDRVDRLRPFAVTEPESVDTRETQYDAVKLWNFFWDERDAFDKHYAETTGAGSHITPGTMTTDWWRTQVPELWKHTENKGPGDFRPNPWAPVRWTKWQFQEYDDAPVVGYLERPVPVRLTDDHGAPLREQRQTTAFQEGWQKLIGSDSGAGHPARVFFDTTGNREFVIPLTQALGSEPNAPSTGDLKEGFDIGYRLGDTGVTSGLVQIALSLMTGYSDGKSSVAVIRDDGGNAELIRVTPPDDADKKRNAANQAITPKPFN